MLDKIAMITLLIIMILGFLTVLCTYFVILGADRLENDEEKEYEDQEQMEYIKNYQSRRKGKRNGNKNK